MNLYLFDEKEIITFTLPDKIIGNFWMTDREGKNIVNINAKDNQWVVSGSNNSNIILDNNYVEEAVLRVKSYYLVEKNSNKYVLFVDNVLDNTFTSYKFDGNTEISVGKDPSCCISQFSNFINDVHLKLNYNNGIWSLVRDSSSLVYLNNELIVNESIFMHNGDVLNIFGLKIVLVFNILFINNPFGNININTGILNNIVISSNDEVTSEEIMDQPLYKDDDYFFKSPRLRRTIEKLDMKNMCYIGYSYIFQNKFYR